jgi:hypothetical protein
MGVLDYFEAHVRELGQLIAWARETFGGPVAVGGVSLGALTAQLVASAAGHWPVSMRPDAVFLATCSASIMPVVMDGALTSGIDAPRVLLDHGWAPEHLAQWVTLLEPGDTAAVPGERIVVLLGERDEILPIAEGRRLAHRWAVPEDNLFLYDLGHFTASLALYRDSGPFDRLKSILATV